jgi:hypothetical protein
MRSCYRNTANRWRLFIAICRSAGTIGRGPRPWWRGGFYEQDPRLGIVFRRELLAEQEHVTKPTLTPWVIEFAKRNKLDEKGIVAAMTDPRLAAMVDQDIQTAAARGIRKIPAVYVAGQSFVETIIYDDVARVLDNALAR